MALTESQKLKCARILGVTYIEVNDKITNLGTNYITAQVESDIQTELDRWDEVYEKFTVITPNVANSGASVDPERRKADIRKNLSLLLYFEGEAGTTNRLQRS